MELLIRLIFSLKALLSVILSIAPARWEQTRKLGSCDLFRIERYAVINDIFFSFLFLYFELTQAQRQILQDLNGVLEAAGSSLKDVNIFLTDMEDFTWVNEISDTYFCDPKPASKLTHSLVPAFFF